MEEISHKRRETQPLVHIVVRSGKNGWGPRKLFGQPCRGQDTSVNRNLWNEPWAPCRHPKIIWWVATTFLDEGKPSCLKSEVIATKRKWIRLAMEKKIMNVCRWKIICPAVARNLIVKSYMLRPPTDRTQPLRAEITKMTKFQRKNSLVPWKPRKQSANGFHFCQERSEGFQLGLFRRTPGTAFRGLRQDMVKWLFSENVDLAKPVPPFCSKRAQFCLDWHDCSRGPSTENCWLTFRYFFPASISRVPNMLKKQK